jgi:light-regulated signal transduction histidine kinase (bacteriophytochrome)
MTLEAGSAHPQQAEHELAVVQRMLEQFPHAMSHDLTAPLRSIASLMQIVQEDYAERLGEEGANMLKVACTGCQRLDERLTALLDLSQTLRHPLDIVTVDMHALALEAWAATTANHHAVIPPRLIVEALPACHGDVELLRAVWRHLLDNAVKYSAGQREPEIRVGANVQRDECCYQVFDNGVGFDMRHVSKLFGLFQRLHKAEDFGGAGMGLAIVRGIVERHGGRTAAQSSPGAGARFEFTLSIAPN